jgi:hypothetical protein
MVQVLNCGAGTDEMFPNGFADAIDVLALENAGSVLGGEMVMGPGSKPRHHF